MPFQFSKDTIKKELEQALGVFQERLMRINTGQVNPGAIEDVKVMYQGFEMNIKELASIRIEGARTLVVEPWDKGSIGDIERSLIGSRTGLNPQVKGSSIYLNFPALTQEMREAATKDIKEMKEEARVKLRHIRDTWWEAIQKAQEEGEVREDDKFRFKDELQHLVDEYNVKTDETAERKIKSLS